MLQTAAEMARNAKTTPEMRLRRIETGLRGLELKMLSTNCICAS